LIKQPQRSKTPPGRRWPKKVVVTIFAPVLGGKSGKKKKVHRMKIERGVRLGNPLEFRQGFPAAV